MRDIKQLHPELQRKIDKLKYLCEREELPLGIGECLRTVKEQDDLYAQGRTRPGAIVTYARGSQYASQHQWGIAFDFFKAVPGHAYDDTGFFHAVASLAKNIGLAWGGDWITPVDMPHIYLPHWGDTPAPLKRQFTIPENFFSSWAVYEDEQAGGALDVDGWMGPATVTRLQKIFKTPADGVITDQWIWYKDQNPGIISAEWVHSPRYGSSLVKALQAFAGATVDGVIGPETISALQIKFGTTVDGCVSGPSQLVMAMQSWANDQK